MDGSININGINLDYAPYNFIKVYAGGINIYAGVNLINQLYIWNNDKEEIFEINGNNWEIILTDDSYGIVYNDNFVISLSQNKINSLDTYYFITNEIYTNKKGYFEYTLSSDQIYQFNSLNSNYITFKSKYHFMDSSMVYSEILNLNDNNINYL